MARSPDPSPTAAGAPTAAMIVIGDELLSGRTRDANTPHLAQALEKVGIRLREVRIVPDEEDAIVEAVRALAARHDHVFTSGGIGPTHDDITADAVARAFGRPVGIHPEAHARLVTFYEARGIGMNAARLRMARIPEGARLIDNPVSAAPGFSVENVHVMAGVPSIFREMLAGLLPRLAGGVPLLVRAFLLRRPEGEIAALLGEIAAAHPDVAIGSYPSFRADGHETRIVLRSADPVAIEAARAALTAAFPDLVTDENGTGGDGAGDA